MRYFCGCLMIVSGMLLTGCARIDRYANPNDYRSVKSVPPLTVPSGLSSKQFEDYYPVPQLPYPSDRSTTSILPPGSSLIKK